MNGLNLKTKAINEIEKYFDNGLFLKELDTRVKFQTVSRSENKRPELYRYLKENLSPYLSKLGFNCKIVDNVENNSMPIMTAVRIEEKNVPTIFSYAHADVVPGHEDRWLDGLSPWKIIEKENKYFGRGTADNKGQHTINFAALKTVLNVRGYLGFNIKILIETGEEVGSPGLKKFCKENAKFLSSDLLIASDGPRLNSFKPSIFLGSRGEISFNLELKSREEEHHSGNWGGLLSNPAIILSNAISTIVNKNGEILVSELKAKPLPNSIRKSIRKLKIEGDKNSPKIDNFWGEPGNTSAEKLYGTNTFEVKAWKAGNPEEPANAIPAKAKAICHMRFIKGTKVKDIIPTLKKHLINNGFKKIKIELDGEPREASRLDPDHQYVKWIVNSIKKTTNLEVDVIPNIGSTIPNDIFTEHLQIPTIWIPHSYGGCLQHAPNEHILKNLTRDALKLMTGIWWDLGENPPKIL